MTTCLSLVAFILNSDELSFKISIFCQYLGKLVMHVYMHVCVCVYVSPVSQKMYDSWSQRRCEIHENMHCVSIGFQCLFYICVSVRI